MPVHLGQDEKGCFAQWGGQKKYRYQCGNSEARQAAVRNANAQAKAIYSSGYVERNSEKTKES
jgi:hypothetical protein